MPEPDTAARFIVLEGIDGAGKSSQVEPLAAWLRERGLEVVTCRDPGSTPAGDAVRGILLDRHEIQLDATAEMFLYMAARAQMVAEVIRPALTRGAWVVCDRFLMSNIVYQGHAGTLDPETVRRVGELATGGLEPDLVLWLDIDLETAAARLDRPLDKLENRGDGYRRRLREGYRCEADRDRRTRVVDAAAGVETVAASIRTAVAAAFPQLPE